VKVKISQTLELSDNDLNKIIEQYLGDIIGPRKLVNGRVHRIDRTAGKPEETTEVTTQHLSPKTLRLIAASIEFREAWIDARGR
jgi:hypothetical protein